MALKKRNIFVPMNVKGSFCPSCGASLTRLTRSERRVLATIWIIEEEHMAYALASQERDIPMLERMATVRSVVDRCGLDKDVARTAMTRLRNLGYLTGKKAYMRRMYVYALSAATYADHDLMQQIETWAEFVPPPSHLTPISLHALRQQAHQQRLQREEEIEKWEGMESEHDQETAPTGAV